MRILEDAEIRLNDVCMPEYYRNYQHAILKNVQEYFEVAKKARNRGLDTTDIIESKIAYDLADRVAKMHNIDIADRLRFLLSQTTKEKAALKISEEIALGDYGIGDLEARLDNAVRVSLAVVTEGVTVASLQGIADVKLKDNANNTKYLSVSFAGPIRSAGGTEAALTMLIADHVRKVAGVDKYIADSYDDETGRFVEELRIYEREVGSFQFKVLDEDVVKCITNLSVELDGVDTDPVEIVGHRSMKRISTDRVRGGALRVMNDGLIGRSRKLLKLVETLKLTGWDWLGDLKGAIQTGDDDAAHHRMSEVITGRPVLSMNKKIGGFRLRYGRCYNTGFATIGIHPTVPILLNHAIVVGTQIKMDVPWKSFYIALVDSLEPPLVKLHNGSVLQITTLEKAVNIRLQVEKIIYLGDILISYGDFLENNAQLLPASYVEEIWARQLQSVLKSPLHCTPEKINERLIQLSKEPFTTFPTVEEAFEISRTFNIPLHPKYSFYWDSVNIEEVLLLREIIDLQLQKLHYRQHPVNKILEIINSSFCLPNDNTRLKDILERLGVFHSLKNESRIIEIDNRDQIYSLIYRLFSESLILLPTILSKSEGLSDNRIRNSIELISKISGIKIKPKFASSIAVRVGRPEKVAERK